MRQKQLERIRNLLIDIERQKFDSMSVDMENETLALLNATEEMAAAKMAGKILELLPDPEPQEVRDYRAIKRVVDRKVWNEGMNDAMGADVERTLYSAMHELEERAIRQVENRLEVNERDDERIVIEDRHTSMRQNYMLSSTQEADEEFIETLKQEMAYDIVTNG